MSSPFLYLPGDRLALAELSAARLDGHVVEVGDGFMPADAVETADLRAGSLRDLLGRGLAAVRLSAAWVWGALDDPPERHTVQRTTRGRAVLMSTGRLRYSDVVLPDHDTVVLSGGVVSTPARTLADLARATDAESQDAARALARARPEAIAETLDWFERWRGMPGARAGKAVVRRLQDEVTRYTS